MSTQNTTEKPRHTEIGDHTSSCRRVGCPELETPEQTAQTVCKWCDDKGIIHKPNGPDDVEDDFCTCAIGRDMMWMEDDRKVEKETDDDADGLEDAK